MSVTTSKTIPGFIANSRRARCIRFFSTTDESLKRKNNIKKTDGPVFVSDGDKELQNVDEINFDIKPWRSLLEVPARASWRVTEDSASPTSDAYVIKDAARALMDVSVARTNLQLKKTHESVVRQHRALANRRDRERMRTLSNRSDQGSRTSIKKDEAAQPVAYGPDEALQHIQFRLIPQYAIVKRVLQEAKSLLMTNDPTKKNWRPKRILDFGIGCGSATAAALDVWDVSVSGDNLNNDGIEWIHGIDPSQTMREASQSLLEDLLQRKDSGKSGESKKLSNNTRVTVSAHISTVSSNDSAALFDLALMAYTASEFTQNASTLAAAALLWEKLRPDGVLVMIEPGTPDGFSSIRTVRNMLLHCINGNEDVVGSLDKDGDDFFNPADYTTDDGENDTDNEVTNSNDFYHELAESEIKERFLEECHIIAPCTHNGPCPLERFSQMKEKLKKREKKANKRQEEAEKLSSSSMEKDSNEAADVQSDDTQDNEVDDDEDIDDESDETHQGFCSFVQTMPGSSFGLKGEKFSYLVVQKRVIDQQSPDPIEKDVNNTHFEELNVANLLHRTYQQQNENTEKAKLFDECMELESLFLSADDDELGLELLRGDKNRQSFGRIISAPKKKKGHVLIETCNAPGLITRHTVKKSMVTSLPGIYSAARKSRWGGLWPNVSLVLETKDSKK